MKKIIQFVLIAIILAGIGFTIYSGVTSKKVTSEKASSETEEVKEYPEIGYKAPAFTLKDLEGKLHTLKDYKGKPVILNFWASWCGPCIEEAPNFTKIHGAYGDQVQLLTINLTTMDNIASAKAFVKEHGYQFPTLLDTEGKAADDYLIKPIPTTFFIDKNGIIVDGVYGGLIFTDLEARTKQLIQTSNSTSN